MKERFFVVGRVNKVVSIVSFLAVLLTLGPSLRAQFVLSTNNGTLTVKGYGGPGGEVAIPSTINNMPVTAIGDWAFAACSNLNITRITVPNSVTQIGSGAFSHCATLTRIDIPASVTNIGSSAFSSCSSLTNVVLPPDLRSIGDGTFEGCTNLTEIAIPNAVTSIGQRAFAGAKLTVVTIPSSVTNLAANAFKSRELTMINVDSENPVYSSVDGMLLNKSQTLLLACPPGKSGEVRIPNGVTRIESEAFLPCALTSVSIPSTVTNMGLFQYCENLTNITVDLANPVYSSVDGMLLNKDQTLLLACPRGKVGDITIPNSVTTVAYEAFRLCKIKSLAVPRSVTDIETFEFGFECGTNLTTITVDSANPVYSSVNGMLLDKGQTSLIACPRGKVGSLTIPEGIITIEPFAFSACNVQSISIPASVTSIGDGAFEYCSRLTSVSIPNSVTSIGYGAFAYSGLTNVTIPGSITSWGDCAFLRCLDLTEVLIQDGVTSIGHLAFADCPSLSKVTIPEGVGSIGGGAFSVCTTLSSIIIPSSVIDIGSYAFSLCANLQAVFFKGNAPTASTNTFFSSNPTIYYTRGTTGWETTFENLLRIWWDGLSSPEGNYLILTNGNAVTITAYTGRETDITIPSTIRNMPVVTIGDHAFAACSNFNITRITVPNGVTSIGTSAFYGTSPTNIVIPASVTNIGVGAFNDCYRLTAITVDGANSVYCSKDGMLLNKSQTLLIRCPQGKVGEITIPNGVTTIDWDAFGYCALTSVSIPSTATNMGWLQSCTNLTSINVDSENPVYSSVDGMLLNKDRTLLMECPPGKTGNIMIPNGVKNVADLAFYDCSMTNIWVPQSVTNMIPRGWGFECGTNLTTITVDSANPAYSSVDGLLLNKEKTSLIACPRGKVGSLTIPEGIITIEPFAFSECNVQNVSLPTSVTSIENGAFRECRRLTTISIPNGVFKIGYGAFWHCGLTTLIIPGRVAFFEDYAFAYCQDLVEVVIQYGVTSIPQWTFEGCSSLSKVVIPESVRNIGDGAFRYCTNLQAVYFRGNTPTVTTNAFDGSNPTIYYLSGTTGWGSTFAGRPTVLLDDSPAEIQLVLETNSNTLTITGYKGSGGELVIPSSVYGMPVVGIGSSAFKNCTNLASISIPSTVTNIGYYAFNNCTRLTHMSIPSSVANIGWLAFFGCTSLTNVTLPDGLKWIDGATFAGCRNLTGITIPDSVTTIYWNAFDGSGLTNIVIPNSVTKIGQEAFANCSSLTQVTIPNTLTRIESNPFPGCRNLMALTVDSANPAYCSVDGIVYNKSRTSIIAYPGGKTGSFTIPDSVVYIDTNAFGGCALSSVVIPGSVTNIQYAAFAGSEITKLTILDGVADITYMAFANCTRLTSISLPDTITHIESGVFEGCSALSQIVISSSVTDIGYDTFSYCTNLQGIYFRGNAASVPREFVSNNATVYHLPGTTGWGSTFAGLPTAVWRPSLQAVGGIENTSRATFKISWAPGTSVVVETCTNLVNPTWVPQTTNFLAGSEVSFSDPEWTNSTARFYRVRVP